MKKWRDLLEASPIIAAVKDDDGLQKALGSECGIIFTLYGNICTIPSMVHKIKESGKTAIVHMDFIQGLGAKEVAVDFLRENAKADGIISTKTPLVKRAVTLKMIGIQRTFIVDSIALSNTKKQLDAFRPDALEILPGIMPKIIREMHAYTEVPIIAGGLLSDKKDVMDAFHAGADAISATHEELWSL